MAWQLIDPRYYAAALKRPGVPAGSPGPGPGPGGAAGAVALWYRDDGQLDTGELLLWLDTAGRVSGFQLSHAKWPHGREHLAEWHEGTALRVGEVDSGEGFGEGGGGRKRSPIVRFLARPDPQILEELAQYFEQHAAVVEPQHRDSVAAVLRGGLRR